MRNLQDSEDKGLRTLIQAVEAFASHLASYGEPRLASVVADTLTGDADELPERFFALFRHGMGGLLDMPLYTKGHVDQAATDERDRLAEVAYQLAGC